MRFYTEAQKEAIREYRRANKEKSWLKTLAWRKANPEKWSAIKARDYAKNKARVFATNAKNTARRKEQDFGFRILINLRGRVAKAIQYSRKGTVKIDTTKKLLGCSGPELLSHLENRFLDGMSWDNYGPNGWHVDHIKPCALFDLSDPKQQKECFHFTNLQPLWAKDNRSKGKKYHGS